MGNRSYGGKRLWLVGEESLRGHGFSIQAPGMPAFGVLGWEPCRMEHLELIRNWCNPLEHGLYQGTGEAVSKIAPIGSGFSVCVRTSFVRHIVSFIAALTPI